jgi:hopanoid biosynthesis associated protein HpnK
MGVDVPAPRGEVFKPGRSGDPIAAQRRLVVNADDFGRSASINAAVIRAHREGILTTASLMVNEPAFQEAVALAHANPGLGVGLHLTFVCGHSALPHEKIPGLVNREHEFSTNAARTGLRFFFSGRLKDQLREEIHAQFARFRSSGLRLDHVNGHLHLHLHPTVFRLLMADARTLGIERLRLTRDPLWLNLRLARGQLFYRLSHALVFHSLSASARPMLNRKAVRHTHNVFGLLQNARVDEDYIRRLLPLLPEGDSELYSHPSLDEFEHEFRALVSPRVRAAAEELGIRLIRYQDL